MKFKLAIVLVFVALSLASLGQAFASGSPSFYLTSSCEVIERYICGPTTTITVSSVNGFTGTVSLSTAVTPYCTKCTLTATVNPTSVSVPSGGNATSTLRLAWTCHETYYCQWIVTVTGTSGSLTNSTDVYVCIRTLGICPH